MRLIEQVELKLEWSDINNRIHHPLPPPHPRSPGVHLSNVLRYVAMESGILAKPGVDSTSAITDLDEAEMPVRMMLGMFFEDGMSGMYPEMQWQPGEMERDGVFGTPDGLSQIHLPEAERVIRRLTGEPVLVIDEFKLTWKSEWNFGKDNFTSCCNWMWHRQGMGYLAMLQHMGIDVAPMVRYHIGWVCGDYRPPSPKLCRYLVEFTQAEIDGNWGMVLRNKNKEGVRREG